MFFKNQSGSDILNANKITKMCQIKSECWKIGNVLFNDTLNTFHLWLCGSGHMVKDHSDSERGSK